MMKLVLFLLLLIITLPLISESFSYFDADMINHDLENKNYHLKESNSGIIQFNEPSNEQQVKRYLIFGKGSISEIGNFVQTPYSISSSNGFFSIVTVPESTLSIFQSKGFHIIEDFQLDFHSKYSQKIILAKYLQLETLQILNVYTIFTMLLVMMSRLL